MTEAHKPNFDLTGKTVLVTGASRGIGKAIAQACAASGADVVLGVRNEADAAGLVADFKAQGRRAMAVKIDLPDLKEARASVAKAHAAMGRMVVLVNNVGSDRKNL